MPELPEVETIRRRLARTLLGRRVLDARVSWARTLAEPSAGEARRRVRGQAVRAVERRGKHLLLRLTRDTLMLHLGMSGSVHLRRGEPCARHTRLSLALDRGWRLDLDDPRKFGRARLVADPMRALTRLGPEPLERGFTAATLAARLHAHRRALKPLLLDQSFVAGLGNIYADEALHRARLHPLRRSDRLAPLEARALWHAIRSVLRAAIARHGTTFDRVYGGGEFQSRLRVYQRTGEPCPCCGATIARIVVAARGTHFCPCCQKRDAVKCR